MKAQIFYFKKEPFMKNPERFFNSADETEKMLDYSGLKNFALVDTYNDKDMDIPKDAYAERMFALYNDGAKIPNPLGTKEGQEKLRSLGVGHTSMSVSDFVVIDGDVLIVDGVGFKNIGQHDALNEVVEN